MNEKLLLAANCAEGSNALASTFKPDKEVRDLWPKECVLS